MSVKNNLKTDAEAETRLKKPSEITSRRGGTTALVYRRSAAPPRRFILAPRRRRRSTQPVHGRLRGRRCRRSASTSSPSTFSTPKRSGKLPDRGPVLEECYRAVIVPCARNVEARGRAVHRRQVDGRTHRDAGRGRRRRRAVAGLVLLGYPLHPPGQPHKLRDAHLPSVRRPMLFVQGSRDTFGTPESSSRFCEGSTPRADGARHRRRRSFVQAEQEDPVRQPGLRRHPAHRRVDYSGREVITNS